MTDMSDFHLSKLGEAKRLTSIDERTDLPHGPVGEHECAMRQRVEQVGAQRRTAEIGATHHPCGSDLFGNLVFVIAGRYAGMV